MQDQATIDRPPESMQQHQGPQFAATEEPETEQEPQDVRNAPENKTALFEAQETEEFHSRWYKIQTEFIDDPRRCVQRADELVAETMKRLSEVFGRERQKLESEWDRGEDVSTEDLRLALQRYRSFFDRLLSV
jgi:hypothetical protein